MKIELTSSENTAPANLPIGAVADQHDFDFPEDQLNPHPVLARCGELPRASAPPSAPAAPSVRRCGSLSILHSQFSIPPCRRAPLHTWLLNSLRSWRECFTWRAAFESLSDWIRAAFSPRPPRQPRQSQLQLALDYTNIFHDGESDPEAPHA